MFFFHFFESRFRFLVFLSDSPLVLKINIRFIFNIILKVLKIPTWQPEYLNFLDLLDYLNHIRERRHERCFDFDQHAHYLSLFHCVPNRMNFHRYRND